MDNAAISAASGFRAAPLSRYKTTSPLVTLPPGPVPVIRSASRRFSAIRRRTEGDNALAAVLSGAAAGVSTGFAISISGARAAAFGTGSAGAGSFRSSAASIDPTTAPIATVSPSGTLMCNTPSASATTSRVTLSVSMRKTGSSFRTRSPSFLNHWARTASFTDSPTLGTLMSMAIMSPVWQSLKNQSLSGSGPTALSRISACSIL